MPSDCGLEMKTRRDFLNILRDSNKWPGFNNPDFLDELNKVADSAFNKKTIEGYLAALLIYHQLCEEMLKVLIKATHFYVQCAIFPQQIEERKLDRMMFGQLVAGYENSVQSNGSKELIDKCKGLNKIRINMVHKITLKTSVSDIQHQTKKVKSLFDSIWELFDVIYDEWRVTLKDYRKEIEEFEEMLSE